MSEFKRGQEIEAVKPIRLANGITLEAGSRGVVIGMGSHDTVSVQFDDYIGGVSVWASLIAPTTHPAPATAPAAGLSAFAQAVQGDDSLAVALYEAAAMTKEAEDMHKRVDELEAQLAATEARLQAAVGALEPFAELYRDWLVNRQEIEFFDYLNRYRVSDELLADAMNASVKIQEINQSALQPTE